MSRPVVTEVDLHAHVDGVLPAERAAEVDAYLAEHPGEAARLAAYREQNAALHREFDPVLDERLPRQLTGKLTRESLQALARNPRS